MADAGITVTVSCCVRPPKDPDTRTLCVAVTAKVVMANVAAVSPFRTVTCAGTLTTEALSLTRGTSAPPLGAGPVRVTVPVAPDPPATFTGVMVSERSARFGGGCTVSGMVWLTPLNDAVMPTTVCVRIVVVSMVKVAVVAPCGTRTLSGTEAIDRSSLVTMTRAPPVPAGLVNVTVALTGRPPTTDAGERTSEARTTGGGATVNVAETEVVPVIARIVAVTVVVIVFDVVIVKVAEVDPATTVTFAGTDTAALSLLRVTSVPPAGAAPLRVTVPVALMPPVTLGG